MRALLLALLVTGCGNYSNEQGWDHVPCMRVPDGTPGKLTVAFLRALDDWDPPFEVNVTESASCENEIRFGNPPDYGAANSGAKGVTPSCIGIDGEISHRSIVVSPIVPDCRLDAVVRHEVGHWLGLLAHGSDGSGVMVDRIDKCDDPQISEHERERLRELYL